MASLSSARGYPGRHVGFCDVPVAACTLGAKIFELRPLRGAMPFWLSWFSSSVEYNFDPFVGVRVGEAANPGPAVSRPATLLEAWNLKAPVAVTDNDGTLRVAVLNPTAILGKTSELLSLNSEVLLISETSAVASTQVTLSKQMRAHGNRCFWSPPVASHSTGSRAQPSRRGHAAGTAVMARVRSHALFEPVPDVLLDSQRYAEACVKVGALSVHVASVYGFPANRPQAGDLNHDLLASVLQHLGRSRLPVLLGGDFNCDVRSLPVWRSFQEAGFQELHSLFEQLSGRRLPPTCRESTSWDTMLLSPPLVKLFINAWVESNSALFDSHSPVIATFKAPGSLLVLRRWRLPVPWTELRPDPHQVSTSYAMLSQARPCGLECLAAESLDSAFQQWASDWEEAVHLALRASHHADPAKQPSNGLPRKCRGRCQPRTRSYCLSPLLAKPGRHGDFNPQADASTVLARQHTRQVRRVESLLRHLRAVAGGRDFSGSFWSLSQQWQAIIRGPGYPPSFPEWVLQVAHFHEFPMTLPSVEWLSDLLTYVRFECNALVQQESARRARFFQARVRHDEAQGSPQAFQHLRKHAHPPLQAVPFCARQDLRLAFEVGQSRAAYHCSFPEAFSR